MMLISSPFKILFAPEGGEKGLGAQGKKRRGRGRFTLTPYLRRKRERRGKENRRATRKGKKRGGKTASPFTFFIQRQRWNRGKRGKGKKGRARRAKRRETVSSSHP